MLGKTALAIVVSALFAGIAVAASHSVAVSAPINTSGLDLSRPADVRTLYRRVKGAAEYLCGTSNRVGLAPADDPKGCYETALGDAIRSAKLPMLTRLYLNTHTIQEATARGIEIPPQVSARN